MKITKEESTKLVESVVQNNKFEIEVDGYTIGVCNIVDRTIAQTIVQSVVEGCFADGDAYDPITKEFLKKALILSAFSDIELPEKVEEKYAFIYSTGFYEAVIRAIDPTQLSEIFDAIEEGVRQRLQMDTNIIGKSLVELYAELHTIMDGLKSVYDGVDGDQMTKFINAVSDSKLDEGKLISAITSTKQ